MAHGTGNVSTQAYHMPPCSTFNPGYRMTSRTSQMFTDLVWRAPSQLGNSDVLAFWQKFELAVKTNGWTYLEAANHLACSLTGQADNCLNKVSNPEDLANYKLLMRLLENWFCPEDQTNHFHSKVCECIQCPNKDTTTFIYAFN